MRALAVQFVAFLFVLISHGIEVQASVKSPSHFKQQPYRTAYHFQPVKNWMNDPNGPMYYKGVYHLFYQYNPYGAVWGNIVWAHSISYDLVNWVHLDFAIIPSESYDINGCWSGSATLLPDGKPAILYTGIDTKNRQVQNLAVPKNLSDPLLIEWIKSPNNPLMTPVDDIDPKYFRDPSTSWQGRDGLWRVIVGNEVNDHGRAILYHSKDFVNWTRSKYPLHASTKTIMWECPDFYPVAVKSKNGLDTSAEGEFTKHVLKISYNYHDWYVLGKYTPQPDTFAVENDFTNDVSDLRYDYGKFYASKTFFDHCKKRRILWGWVNESDSEVEDIKKGWSGVQTIPRAILLSKDGRQLLQWPIKEIEKLRAEEVSFHGKELKAGSVLKVPGITGAQVDVEVSFEVPNFDDVDPMDPSQNDPQLLCSGKNALVRGRIGPLGILALASEDLNEQTAVFFRIFRRNDKYVVLMCSDQSRSSLREGLDKTSYGAFVDLDPQHEKISLRSLIDHSIIESFGGEGKTCITARVYPKLAIDEQASHLYVFNNGTLDIKITKLSAWSMKRAQIVPAKVRRKSHIN